VDTQGAVFHTFQVDELIPAGHPLRAIKQRADAILVCAEPTASSRGSGGGGSCRACVGHY